MSENTQPRMDHRVKKPARQKLGLPALHSPWKLSQPMERVAVFRKKQSRLGLQIMQGLFYNTGDL